MYGLCLRETCSAKPLLHSHHKRLSQRMFLFQRFLNRRCRVRETTDIGWEEGLEKKKGHRRLIVIPTTSASSIYNHCGSRANLGLHVNGEKKLFFVCCLSLYWWKMLSFFGTYALDISSLTSIKYISEKYKNLLLCHFAFTHTQKNIHWVTQGKGLLQFQAFSTSIDKNWFFWWAVWVKSIHQMHSQFTEILLSFVKNLPESLRQSWYELGFCHFGKFDYQSPC